MGKTAAQIAAAEQEAEQARIATEKAAAEREAEQLLAAAQEEAARAAGVAQLGADSIVADDAAARREAEARQSAASFDAALQADSDRAAGEQLENEKRAKELDKSAKHRQTLEIAALMKRHGLKLAAIETETGAVHFDADYIARLKSGTFETITEE